MPFPAVITLANLDGGDGFRVGGLAAFDLTGSSVASAGDINGDGIGDFIVGASGTDYGNSDYGAAYIVFGKDTSSGDFPADFDLTSLYGPNGFMLRGAYFGDRFGGSVASAGDVNGDGIHDLIIGAYGVDDQPYDSGASFVIFGRAAGFGPVFDVSGLDGTNGFRIVGGIAAGHGGKAVGSGDFNGDGISDLLMSAPGVLGSPSYVVFGRDTATTSGFDAVFSVADLDGSNGFSITGLLGSSPSGYALASAGDVNGDGRDDIIIGAHNATPHGNQSGAAFVIFGQASPAATISLAALDGSNGFRMDGSTAYDRAGYSVSSAGDINGDGIDDMIVGAPRSGIANYAGYTYVVFGRETGGAFAAALSLDDLDGTDGFRIEAPPPNTNIGSAVAAAGDINGDGLDDILIGASLAGTVGASFVVFGRDWGFSATLSVGSLDGTNGFRLNGNVFNGHVGGSVAGAGDVNGDGVADLIIGGQGIPANGSYSGAAYIVFGISDIINFTGGVGDDERSGGGRNDSLSGMGGKDILRGLAGADLINGGDGNDQLFGGLDDDTLNGEAGGDIVNGDAGEDILSGGAGADKLSGGDDGDSLSGNDDNDRLDGGAGADYLDGGDHNDLLDGGAGADEMYGGGGNDVYIVDDVGDLIEEEPGSGYDIVRTALDGWVLGQHIEALQLQGGGDIDGAGNDQSNNLQGGSGANSLDGAAGVDTINGNDGDDIITGGLGNDLLRGGLGADIFRVSHVATGTVETDQIYDFSAAEDDRLDLSGAFGGTISLVGAFSKQAGQMTLTFAGGITTLRLDTTGDGKTDYQMKINGDVTTESGDWLL